MDWLIYKAAWSIVNGMTVPTSPADAAVAAQAVHYPRSFPGIELTVTQQDATRFTVQDAHGAEVGHVARNASATRWSATHRANLIGEAYRSHAAALRELLNWEFSRWMREVTAAVAATLTEGGPQ